MKQYTIIEKDAKGQLNQAVYFGNTLEEITSLAGFVTVLHAEKIKHPTADTLQRALLAMNVSLVDFYGMCNVIEEGKQSQMPLK